MGQWNQEINGFVTVEEYHYASLGNLCFQVLFWEGDCMWSGVRVV